MKNFPTAISQAELFSTKKEKFEALSGMDALSLRLVEEALNPYRQFGVKKWEKPAVFAAQDASFQVFLDVLDELESRRVTGNKARALVSSTLAQYTEFTATYLARVLLKNLDCGATANTFTKVYPNINIPEFSCMLAAKIDEKYIWKFPRIAEAKYDGNRLLAFTTETKVEYFSRSGKPSDFCNGLFDAELIQLRDDIGEDFVFDGEVLGTTFLETQNAKGSKNDDAKANLKFYLFDLVSMANWKAGKSPAEDQATRSESLSIMIARGGFTKLVKSKFKVCNTYDEVKTFYQEMLTEGYEGLIVKDPLAPYVYERDIAWAKWKPVLDFDLTLVGTYEGTGKYKGTTGGLMLEGQDENGNKIVTDCGSGLNDEMRDYIWKDKEALIARKAVIKIEAQEMSKARDSDVYALRFPVFIEIRTDK